MATKDKAKEETLEMDNDFFQELIKDTDFVMASNGSLMSSRPKVTTPLWVVNCIYGGGIPLGVIGEISGPPSSGKSTFSYQCMGNYQKEYPDGVSVIYDMESSMDSDRLSTLGVDTEHLLRLPATSLESAFASMFKMFGKIDKLMEKGMTDITSFQVFDTISAGGTEKQHKSVEEGNSAFNAGSMMEAPRILKQNLMNVFPYLEKFPVFIGLLNQVFTQMNGYTSSVKSGGGFGLRHAIHFHIEFGKNTDVFAKDNNQFLIATQSMVKLGKSKLSPKMIDIPCYIDATMGGRIDEVVSFFQYISSTSISLIKPGAWYSMKDTLDNMARKYPVLATKEVESLTKNMRKNEIIEEMKSNPDLCLLLQVALIDYINGWYPMQEKINSEYQNELMLKCRYFTR